MSRLIDFDDGFESETVTTGGIVSASDVTVVPSGNLTSTDTQAALTELQGDIDTHTSQIATNAANTATNTANIATNTSNIATNTANIATNTANIASNTSAIATKEPAITAGTTSQYYRGDKTFQTLDKTAVGLSNVDNTSDATKNSAAATLTNKTLTAPVINSGTLNSPILDVASLTEQGSTPTTPSAGTKKLYAKSDGKVYTLDSTGAEKLVGSGAGGGGATNFIVDGDAEGQAISAAYVDTTTSARPVDGVGGTGLITFTQSSTTPLSGTKSFIFSKTGSVDRRGHGRSIDFTIDNASKAKVLQVSFDYQVASGTFNAGTSGPSGTDSDMVVYLYDVTNNRLIQPSTYKLFSNTQDKFSGTFQTFSDSTSYRLIFHQALSGTNNYDLRIDNIAVSPNVNTTGTLRGPVGSIIATSSTTPPPGYLYADGSAVSRTQYAQLFAAIGTTYGAGDGSTTFNLPNTKGIFLRGAGTQTIGGINYTGTLGATQGDQLQGHKHDANVTNTSGNTTDASFGRGNGVNSVTVSSTSMSGPTTDGVNGTPRVGAETRPANLTVAYHICFDSGSVQMSDGYDGRDISMRAYGSTQTFSASQQTTVIFANKSFDATSSYNTTTGVYTVPSSGRYEVKTNIHSATTVTAPAGAQFGVEIMKNGVTYSYTNFFQPTANGYVFTQHHDTVEVVAGDQISIRLFNGGTGNLTFNNTGSSPTFLTIKKLQGPTSISATENISASYRVGTQPSFTGSTEAVVIYTSRDWDTHGMYNSTTGEFTAPASGEYEFVAVIAWNPNATVGPYFLGLRKYDPSTGPSHKFRLDQSMASKDFSQELSTRVRLFAGEKAYIKATPPVTNTLRNGAEFNVLTIRRTGL